MRQKKSLILNTIKSWFIIQVQRYKENTLCNLLSGMKIEFFLPIDALYRTSGRHPIPTLPMIIFISATSSELSNLLKIAPYSRYLRIPNEDTPITLSDVQLKKIKSTNFDPQVLIQTINELNNMEDK